MPLSKYYQRNAGGRSSGSKEGSDGVEGTIGLAILLLCYSLFKQAQATSMVTTKKYICIHGHFYQPPRENAWLEVIEAQDSAAPFHDWNERINFECYAPNTAARILDEERFIRKIMNNYGRINFNFGPTLLSWMEKADPATYKALQDADKFSQVKFNGHGSAIAQVYNHMIMPLANRRDKETQVIWGIRDFEYRFGRFPEGMWLAETAVDTETLEVLAEQKIKYTILAPRQAKAIRKSGATNWEEVDEGSLDTTRPYKCVLPSGREIALFFYNGNVSQGVAFEGLLNNGKYFAERLVGAFEDDDQPQLVHIATDGESYGHHHRHGEMALAACLNNIEENHLAKITNYGEYLAMYPPSYEVQIQEDSSWSCVHGVERWRSNCGCHTGGHPNWTQAWRKPLRETLDWLRDELIPIYEKETASYLKDRWKARNDYIDVILSREDSTIESFLKKHAKKNLERANRIKLIRLMEMQRQSMLMYTSCGWFFDEISGIETIQILQYAHRGVYYAKQLGGVELSESFTKRLQEAPSNKYANGAAAYEKFVVPAAVDLDRVGMHYAASSIFEKYPQRLEFFNFIAESEDFMREKAGNQILVLGRTTVISKITSSRKHFSFAVLYLGQQNMIGNISIDMDLGTFEQMKKETVRAFRGTQLGDVIGLMQEYFGPDKYSIWHLFEDEKRKILKQITDQSLEKAELAYRDIYNDNYQLMRGIRIADIPVPEAYLHAVQFVINADLKAFFEKESLQDVAKLQRILRQQKKWNVPFAEISTHNLLISERIHQELKKLEQSKLTLDQLNCLLSVMETIYNSGLEPDIWKSQNLYFSMLKGYRNGEWVFSSEEWGNAFIKLGEFLEVRT